MRAVGAPMRRVLGTLAVVGRTAIVALVPSAEAVVGRHRQRYDPVAQHGVPAHVTILYPFLPEVDDAATARVAAVCARFPPFRVTFTGTGRFPGTFVWLRPEPAEPFLALTAALATEFPDFPPYAGLVTDPTPHLTVAINVDDLTADALDRVLAPQLPIDALVQELVLLAESDHGWGGAHTWPLGRPAPPG
jgi:2'-5' RNA ligase